VANGPGLMLINYNHMLELLPRINI